MLRRGALYYAGLHGRLRVVEEVTHRSNTDDANSGLGSCGAVLKLAPQPGKHVVWVHEGQLREGVGYHCAALLVDMDTAEEQRLDFLLLLCMYIKVTSC
jgi:hypothetical protein